VCIAVVAAGFLTTAAGAQTSQKSAGNALPSDRAAAPDPRLVDNGTVIENVTLISPERAAPLLHASVVIRDGRISEIGTNLVAGPHARKIDGSGRFLIPGLLDSHVHVGHSAALDDDAIDAQPCCFVNGNLFAGLHKESMIFRLSDADRLAFLRLDGVADFEPMLGRKMKGYTTLRNPMRRDRNVLARWVERAMKHTR